MTDIFTLINQLPDDDIRLQLAFLTVLRLQALQRRQVQDYYREWQMLPIHLHRCLQTS